MSSSDDAYGVNHRRQQRLVAGTSALALLFAIAPRQERALFIVDAPPLSAFGAALPPINLARILNPLYDGGDIARPRVFAPLRAFLARNVPGLPGVGGPDGAGPGIPFVAPGAPPVGIVPPFGAAPLALTPLPGVGGFPFPGASLTPPTSSPVAPGTPGTPTTPGTETPTVPGVTPAVPEPATWATMITGFLLAGAMLRRRRHSSSRRVFRKVTEPS